MSASRVVALLASGVVLACVAPATVSAQTRVHTVEQIILNGKSVDSAGGVSVSRGGTIERAVRRGETILDGTRIDVPAYVELIVASSGGKSTTTLPPGSSVTFVATASGEQYAVNAGRPTFSDVPGALDYFRVQAGKDIDAAAAGTVFSVAMTSDNVTVRCTQGNVNVTKTGYIKVGFRQYKASLVDMVSPESGVVTYRPSTIWYLANFATFAQAEDYFRQQLAAAQHAGNSDAAANALRNIGIVEEHEGNYADALDSHQQALELFGRLGDRDSEALVRMDIGIVQEHQGNVAEAFQSYQDALAGFRQSNDLDGEANDLMNLGNIEFLQGRYADALQSHQHALALFTQLGDREGEAEAIGDIGNVQEAQGQYAAAMQSDEQILALFRQLGDPDREAGSLMNIGIIEGAQSNYTGALQSYQQALALFRQLGDRDGEAQALYNSGIIYEDRSEYTEAQQSYEESLAISRQTGDQRLAAKIETRLQNLQTHMRQSATPPPTLRPSRYILS